MMHCARRCWCVGSARARLLSFMRLRCCPPARQARCLCLGLRQPDVEHLLSAPACRLSNDDLPQLRETLRGVSDEQYRSLLEGVRQYMPAFAWDSSVGGRAFDYTIASLRRRHMNLKALYYNAVFPQQ